MSYEIYRSAFERDGFVVVRSFLSGEELRELNAELDRYIRDVVPQLPAGDAFYQDRSRPDSLKQLQHMGRDPFFAGYRNHVRWQALASMLLAEPAEADEPEWFNKPPGTAHPTPPHQDNYYFCLEPPSVLTIWVALDAVDDENGCLRYVAGSHRRGIRPHQATNVIGFSQGITDYGADDTAQEVAVSLQPGDAAVHHGETIHRADANRSTTRSRRAFAMVFRGRSAQRNQSRYQRYLDALRQQHQQAGLQVS